LYFSVQLLTNFQDLSYLHDIFVITFITLIGQSLRHIDVLDWTLKGNWLTKFLEIYLGIDIESYMFL